MFLPGLHRQVRLVGQARGFLHASWVKAVYGNPKCQCQRISSTILSSMVPALLMECGILRPWRRDDVSSLALIANSRAIARNLTLFPHPYTEQDAID